MIPSDIRNLLIPESPVVQGDMQTRPDFYPLTVDEVERLVAFALDSHRAGDIQNGARATIRLTQAVPGMTCPTPFEDDAGVGDAVTAIECVMARWELESYPYFVIVHIIRVAGGFKTSPSPSLGEFV